MPLGRKHLRRSRDAPTGGMAIQRTNKDEQGSKATSRLGADSGEVKPQTYPDLALPVRCVDGPFVSWTKGFGHPWPTVPARSSKAMNEQELPTLRPANARSTCRRSSSWKHLQRSDRDKTLPDLEKHTTPRAKTCLRRGHSRTGCWIACCCKRSWHCSWHSSFSLNMYPNQTRQRLDDQ